MKGHETSFRCPVDGCSATFSRKSDLRRHDQSVHKGEKKFFCDKPSCIQKDKGFTRKDHFTQHLATHSLPTTLPPTSATMMSNTALRKKRRRSSSNGLGERKFDVDAECDVLRLRAEVKTLRLENEKLQNTVCNIQTLLEKVSLEDQDEMQNSGRWGNPIDNRYENQAA